MNSPELPGADAAHLPFVSLEARRATLSLLKSVGAFESSPNGAWNFVNPQLCDMLGLPASSLLGREWIKRIHPDDVQRAVAEYRQARDSGRSWHHQLRFRRYDDSYMHVLIEANPLPQDPDTPGVSYLGVVSDVSALQRAQEYAEQSLLTVHELLNAVDEGVTIHRDGWIVAANDFAAQLFGYTRASDVIGKHRSQFVAPEDLPALEEASRANLPAQTVATFIRPDGTRFRLSMRAKTVMYAGAPARAAVLMRLDDPLLLQLSQVRLEAQIRALQEQLTLPYNQIAIHDGALKVVAANQAYADFVGRPLAQVIGIDLRELVPPELNEEIWRGHIENLRAGRRRPTFEARYCRPDGTIVRGLVHTVDFRDPVTNEVSAMSFVVPV